MTLLARLLALVFVSVVPSVAILLYNEYDLRAAREEHLRQGALLYASATADELERIVEGARGLLLTIGRSPPVREADWPGCERYLADVSVVQPAYARFAIADRTGHISCASAPGLSELSVAEQPYFQEALARGQFAVGGLWTGSSTGIALLPFAAPFRDAAGRLGGVVLGTLKLDWLARQLERKRHPPGGVLLVADRGGMILARSPNPEQWTGHPIDQNWRPLLEADRLDTAAAVDADGVRRVYGYVPPRATSAQLFVAAGIGTAQVLREIEATSRRGIALVGLAGVVALLATWFAGDRLIRQPVHRLMAVANDLGTGHYGQHPPHAGPAEFGALSRAFADAAHKLAAREGALRASEARFQRLADLTQEGIAIHDGERIVEANEAVARLFGYAPHEIIGQRALAFIAPEARAEADANVKAGLERPYESIGLRKNGTRFPIEVLGRTIEHQGQTLRVIAVRDLTLRKLAEEALRQAEERHRLAVRATNDAIWDWDIETGHIRFNEAIGTLFGYDEQEAGTTLDWWADRIHPDDRARVVKGIKAAVNGSVECWTDEYRFLRADRSWADVVDRAIIVRGPDGKAVRMIGAMLDLTERKLMEAALRHAVEKNQALLREANHRIKNNLQFVSSLLGVQRGALRDPEARSALNEARRRIQAMSRVHERFYKTGEFDRAELGEVLHALREGLVSGAEGEPDVVVAAPVCPVPADMATPLALIANELMTNAIKHAFAPGQRGTVTVSCAIDPDGTLVLTVADDGCGLPPGFDLAGQAGFGLRLVQMMARQIRGEMLVRNGKPGTVVEVRVPPKKAA